MNFWIIDDNESAQDALREVIEDFFPDARVECFEYPHATIHSPSVDVILIDISAVVPIMMSHTAYSAICTLLAKHPGATVVICSAVSFNASQDVRDDVLEQMPEADVRIAAFPQRETLPEILEQIKREQGVV